MSCCRPICMPDPAYFDDIAVLLLALRSMRASADPLR